MNQTWKRLFLPVFLLQAFFFLYVCRHRFIDGDEGYYVLASRLGWQHKTPYLDFFYPQAPLLPYVYALWFKLAGVSWISARTFAALQTAIVGGLIYEHVCHETRKWMAGVSAVVLFASSSLVFAWFPIVKTFPLATLFLFLAYTIVTRGSAAPSAGAAEVAQRIFPAPPGWWLAIAGFFFGLSVDTRSYVIAVAPVLVWWILRRHDSNRRARLLWALAGFTVGVIPSLILFWASPGAFLFNNLGYHAMRSKFGLIGDWRDKALVVMGLFGSRYTGFQFSLMSLTCVAALVRRRMKRDSSVLAFAIAVMLGVVCLLPTPASIQYFSMIVPFLIVAAVGSASDYLDAMQTPREIRVARAICMVALVSFVAFGGTAFRRYLFTGDKVPGIVDEADAPNWRLAQVTAVSNAIDELARPGEQVVSFWPGYLFTSQANPYPGFENDFGMYVARRLSLERRGKYHVLTPEAMTEVFDAHRATLVVIGNEGPWVGGPPADAAENTVRRSGYAPVRKVGGAEIFKCCAAP